MVSMRRLSRDDLVRFVEPNIEAYHERVLQNLLRLKLKRVLRGKNPYLFKAKALETAQDLVKSVLDAHLSSQEEAIFGGLMEDLAVFVCGRVHGGWKSTTEGMDLEFDKDDTRYIVSIKSGPKWGNSRQIARMRDDFRKAKRILRTGHTERKVVAVNGCCYGRDERPDKGDYLKLCGQRFWELVSADETLYTEIIEPLGHRAKKRNDCFANEYAKVINRFTVEFATEYCDSSGAILWAKLVKFNSGKKD
jgi:hypothetical protein